ncbi:MAG: Mur ligase domain-containing protein [Kiritimatiellae bacterium]|nr:Mur ligase domain-containing protein [Kiritimatiellia bacterium]
MSGTVHVAGIGGVGMSALAQALLDEGVRVSGSDRLADGGDMTATLRCLERQGVRLFAQDGSGITRDTARLAVSSAIEADNPEVVKAAAAGVPVVHRAAELARLAGGRRLIAVTGTCGKSSVTALLGCLLEGAGFDPLVVNGAAVAGWDAGGRRVGSVRRGQGEWAVVEADESDRSLMAFAPEHAVITNASADHFGLAETQDLFEAFRKRVSGTVIDGRGEAAGPEGMRIEGWSGRFVFEGLEYRVPLPGAHNVRNAWHAVMMARRLGADPRRLADALAGFGGIVRRLQKVGRCGQAAVVDDYAHNPEKLAAAWTALAAVFPAGICAVWRPHGYGPLRKMMDGLVAVFARVCRPVDRLLLLPGYDAGGTADRSVNSGDLASRLGDINVNVSLVRSMAEAEARMRAFARPERALVTFGARDPGLPRLARRLAGDTEKGNVEG